MNSFIKVLLILLYCTSLFAIEDLPELKRAHSGYCRRPVIDKKYENGVPVVTWRRLKVPKSLGINKKRPALRVEDTSYCSVKVINFLWKLDNLKVESIIDSILRCDLNSSDEQIVFDADNYCIFFKRMFFEPGSFFNAKPISTMFELCFKRKYDGLYELDITIDDINLILNFFKLYILDVFKDLSFVEEQDIDSLENGLGMEIYLGH